METSNQQTMKNDQSEYSSEQNQDQSKARSKAPKGNQLGEPTFNLNLDFFSFLFFSSSTFNYLSQFVA